MGALPAGDEADMHADDPKRLKLVMLTIGGMSRHDLLLLKEKIDHLIEEKHPTPTHHAGIELIPEEEA